MSGKSGRFSGASFSLLDERAYAKITHNAFNQMRDTYGRCSGASLSLLDERVCANFTHNVFNTMNETPGRLRRLLLDLGCCASLRFRVLRVLGLLLALRTVGGVPGGDIGVRRVVVRCAGEGGHPSRLLYVCTFSPIRGCGGSYAPIGGFSPKAGFFRSSKRSLH